MVFLAMPELTRQRVHIFISIVLDALRPDRATTVQRAAYVLAGCACLLGAAFSFDATYKQFLSNTTTVTEWRVQKWVVSAAIPYGLFFAGLHYFRHVFSTKRYDTAGAD